MNRSPFKAVLIAAALMTTPGHSQEEPESPDLPPEARSELDRAKSDPTAPSANLQTALNPLTAEQLQNEAQFWQTLVQKNEEAIAGAELSLQKVSDGTPTDDAGTEAKSNEKSALLDHLNDLRNKRSALLERFDIVLNQLETKGGDLGTMRLYARALGGITLSAGDLETTWATTTGWLTSSEGGIKLGVALLRFFGIMLAFWIAAAVVSKGVHSVTRRQRHLSGLMKRFIDKTARRLVLLIGLMVALSTIGVNVGALVALVGGGAFILGFALQDTLSNFANGVMLLIYRPFDVGDAVEINGVTGNVDAVNLVSTTIRSFDNQVILVPNKDVWGQTIINKTASTERRVDMTFGIGYSDDSDKAQDILTRLVTSHPAVLAEPAPIIRMHELADSSVNFAVRPWVKTADYWSVYWDLIEQVKKTFDKEGISIPFPQRDVHLFHETPATKV